MRLFSSNSLGSCCVQATRQAHQNNPDNHHTSGDVRRSGKADAFLYYRLNKWSQYSRRAGGVGAGGAGPLNGSSVTRTLEVMGYASADYGYDGMGQLIIPGPTGALSTLHFENIRDGLEDHGYLALLRQLVQKAQAAGVDVAAEAAVLTVPKELFGGFQPQPIPTHLGFSEDPALLRAYRSKVAAAIVKLQARLATTPAKLDDEPLANETDPGSASVDVFVFHEGDSICYRAPSLVALQDGRLLAWIEARNYVGDGCVPHTVRNVSQPGHAFLGYKISTDRGRTFGDFVNVTRGADFSVFLTSRNELAAQYPRTHGVGPNMQIISEPIQPHGAIAWREPSALPASLFGELFGANIGPGGGGGIELRNGKHKGRWVFCGHAHARNDSSAAMEGQRATFVLVSDNQGRDWRRTALFSGLNECNVVETEGGGVRLDSRNQRSPVHDFPANFSQCRCRLAADSHDGAESWGPVRMVPSLPGVQCQACMIRQNASTGSSSGPQRWLFSGPNGFAPSCNACARKHGASACCSEKLRKPCNYSGRCYESVWHSTDEGAQWTGPTLVDPGPTGYSSVAALPGTGDASVGVLYERWAEGCTGSSCRVSFARVSLPSKMDDDRVFVSNETDSSGKKYACFRIPALQRVGRTILLFAEGRAGTPGYGFVCRDHGDVRIVLKRSSDEVRS